MVPSPFPSSMEPMLPATSLDELRELAAALLQECAALGAMLPPVSRAGVVELLRNINSYYSNRIEGHHTHPKDIARALRQDFNAEPSKRALQLESVAHIWTQRAIEDRLAAEPTVSVGSPDFLRWIHRTFYERMPDEYRFAVSDRGERAPIVPGELRQRDVTVGAHHPPHAKDLDRYLARFSEAYSLPALGPLQRLIAVAAAHHRLAWIHPFLDGNGRVTRLFTHACLVRLKLGGHGLWMVSRGLARNNATYFEQLRSADEARRGDLDGRGALSDERLAEFCRFFLNTALDQVRFMSNLLNLDHLWRRVDQYAVVRAAKSELAREAGHLLVEAVLKGEVPRGHAARILGLGERSAREVVSQLLREGLLTSPTPRAPLRIAFPADAAGAWFPELFPASDSLQSDDP